MNMIDSGQVRAVFKATLSLLITVTTLAEFLAGYANHIDAGICYMLTPSTVTGLALNIAHRTDIVRTTRTSLEVGSRYVTRPTVQIEVPSFLYQGRIGMSMSGGRPVLVLTLVTVFAGLSANEISVRANLGLWRGSTMTVANAPQAPVFSELRQPAPPSPCDHRDLGSGGSSRT